jgi:hypothetical protein
MSSSPKAFGFRSPPTCVCPLLFPLCHATSSGASGAGLSDPARAATSHSVSVGNRKRRPVFFESHSQYWTAECQRMFVSGLDASRNSLGIPASPK